MLLTEKWAEVLQNEKYAAIPDNERTKVTAQLIENQVENINESTSETGNAAQWNPVMVSMIRRITPRLLAFDLAGVQPLTLPTGLIFFMKSHYQVDKTKAQNDLNQPEALGIDEVNAGFSGDRQDNIAGTQFGGGKQFLRGRGMTTLEGEESTDWNAMGISIEKVSVSTTTRQLRADYSQEIADDMRKVHGLSVDSELVSTLSNTITAELNRELLDRIYGSARAGAQWSTTPGQIDLTADVGGRWSAERFRGLQFAIDRDSNRVATTTRRGRANKLIVSADTASALAFAGIMNYAPGLAAQTNLNVDPSGPTYAGTMGNYAVYVDPYVTGDGYVVGYKGSEVADAGITYCPYIPLSLSRAVNPANFQMALGFKTRYGWAVNPFINKKNEFVAGENDYYRSVAVTGLV